MGVLWQLRPLLPLRAEEILRLARQFSQLFESGFAKPTVPQFALLVLGFLVPARSSDPRKESFG